MGQTFKVPASEIEQRIRRIQKGLQQKDIDGLFVVQRVDLFYFSGTAQNGFLYIPAQGDPLLLIRKYMPRARKESSIKHIIEIKSTKEVPLLIADFYGCLPRILGFEFDVVPVRDFNFYRQLFPGQECVDGSGLIHEVRIIKSEWEVEQMEKTAELSCRTFEYIRDNLKAGYTEMEFAGMIEAFARRLGHGGKLRVRDYQTEGYTWHILSGDSGGRVGLLDSPTSGEGTSAAFPCGAGTKKLAPNEAIMIDFDFVYNGYHIDETRMFAIDAMPKKALDACQAAIEIHNEVLEKIKPGMRANELFHISQDKAKYLGYELPFLGPPGYKVTFIGHGVGLELIEQPIIAEKKKDILRPGMTFALEPKMTFENEFAAGIESVCLVTETGHRLISQIPVQTFVC
ncbi:MAG: Xaa-Pro peptidase family protein [Thermodesulfobacteriota bacterium]|nr:Xaa-Pro peptidase family protein [Thermodesulfobacteriota bacterium]